MKYFPTSLAVFLIAAAMSYSVVSSAQVSASMPAAQKGEVAKSATHADKKAAKANKKAVKSEKKAEQKDAD